MVDAECPDRSVGVKAPQDLRIACARMTTQKRILQTLG